MKSAATPFFCRHVALCCDDASQKINHGGRRSAAAPTVSMAFRPAARTQRVGGRCSATITAGSASCRLLEGAMSRDGSGPTRCRRTRGVPTPGGHRARAGNAMNPSNACRENNSVAPAPKKNIATHTHTQKKKAQFTNKPLNN